MKKLLIASLVFAMVLGAVPALAVTTATPLPVGTNLTPDTTGGAAPVVLAKWEANTNRWEDDQLTVAGAQFLPTGVKDDNRTISICAVVTDENGMTDVNHVYADVYYPENIAVGSSHVKLPSQTGSSTAGCGVLMQEDELTKLTKTDGIALFCNNVRNDNNKLPMFQISHMYGSYEALCKADGELVKETAAVYCVDKDLSYEDPAGEYRVKAVVVDKNGGKGTLENHFDYIAMTAFETDFDTISYGNVRLETEKIINGDLTWDAMNQGKASVRNVGNTRLAMTVSQDDMNFGKTGLLWNVYYKARVGNEFSDWKKYDPTQTVTLGDELDLSEMDEMDFAIFVKKFPDDVTNYSGTMTLGATYKAHLDCQN